MQGLVSVFFRHRPSPSVTVRQGATRCDKVRQFGDTVACLSLWINQGSFFACAEKLCITVQLLHSQPRYHDALWYGYVR